MREVKMINRRNFLKLGFKAGGGALALSAIPITLVAGDEVAEDEPLAQAMGYVKDANDVDTTKFPKRAGEEGAKQFCYNCALYAGEPDAELAPCSIFQNRPVRGAGWCNAPGSEAPARRWPAAAGRAPSGSPRSCPGAASASCRSSCRVGSCTSPGRRTMPRSA